MAHGNLPPPDAKVGGAFAQHLLEAEAMLGRLAGFDGIVAVKETAEAKTSQLLQGAAEAPVG